MCEFCGTKEENERARKGAERFADDLKRLSHHYVGMASGRIRPHTDEMKKSEALAHCIIRTLVEDWV